MRCVWLILGFCICVTSMKAQDREIRINSNRTFKSQQSDIQKVQLKTQKVTSDKCLDCESKWNMLAIEDVKALKAEIETHKDDPNYQWKHKLKYIYSSPHVMQVPVMDPTFPIIILTGDSKVDMQAYNQAKKEWVQRYPDRYKALKNK